MNDTSVGGEIAAQRTEKEMLIEQPGFLGGDTGTMTADIDGLCHLKLVTVREGEADKEALREALFRALTCSGSRQGHTVQF